MIYRISELRDLRTEIKPQPLPHGGELRQFNCTITGSTFCCCDACRLDERHADVLRRFGHQVLGAEAITSHG